MAFPKRNVMTSSKSEGVFKPAPYGDDTLEWTEVFPVSPESAVVFDKYSSVQEWLGGTWKFLFRQNASHNTFAATVGVYVGLENPHLLTPGWNYNLDIQFVLVSPEGELFDAHSTKFDYKYSRPEQEMAMLDRGHDNAFPGKLLPNFASMQLYDGSLQMCYKVLVRVNRYFLPTRCPMHYNSKQLVNMVGLENLGATCYLNALLQMLYHINEFRRCVYQLPMSHASCTDVTSPLSISSSTTLALQSIFRNLQCSDIEVTTKDLTRAFGWTSTEAFMQQDVQEMMRVLLDKLEEKMKGTSVDGTVYKLFGGKVRSYIKCENVDYESTRDEDFYDIQLDVKDCATIQDSFKQYVATEMLDGENQYDAGPEHGKQDAKKGVMFIQFPPVLTIHLKRFAFNMQHMGFTKIHDYFEFPLELDLNDYLSDEAEEDAKLISNVYELHSVLVHSGDVHGGHYYAYIRPSSGHMYGEEINQESSEKDVSSKWYQFNDEKVFEVDKMEAVDNCFGQTDDRKGLQFPNLSSSAYMLVYVRKAEGPKVMRPVLDKDIPQLLGNRLGAERQKELQLRHDALVEEHLTTVSYFLEYDVAMFSMYSNIEDFVPMRGGGQKLSLLKNTTRLGVMLRIARLLNISPFRLKVYSIEWRDKNSASRGFRLSSTSSGWLLDGPQILNKCNSSQVYVHILDDATSLSDDVHEFEKKYLSLRNDEVLWQKSLQEYMTKEGSSGLTNDAILAGGRNWASDCGVGMFNTPLDWIRDKNACDEFKTKLNVLNNEFTDLCAEFSKLHGEDVASKKKLCFFKAYDPHGDIPLWIDANQITAQDVFSEADHNGTKSDGLDTENNAGNIAAKFDAQRALLLKCPVRYLGSKFVDPKDQLITLASVSTQFIKKARHQCQNFFLNNVDQLFEDSDQTVVNSDVGESDCDVRWLEADSLFVWCIAGVNAVDPLIPDDMDTEECRKKIGISLEDFKHHNEDWLGLRNGDIYCCELLQMDNYRYEESCLASLKDEDVFQATACQWILYQTHLKSFSISPYDDAQVEKLQRILSNISISGSKKRSRSRGDGDGEYAIVGTDVEGNGMDVSHVNQSVVSVSPPLLSEMNLKKVTEDPVEVLAPSAFTKTIDIPTNLSMGRILNLIAASLSSAIHASRIILYPCNSEGTLVESIIPGIRQELYSSANVKTCVFPLGFSSICDLEHELHLRKATYTTFGLKYRFSPFPTSTVIVHNKNDRPCAEEMSCFDAHIRQFVYHLNDARLRKIRRRFLATVYLEETRHIPAVLNEAVSLSYLAVGANVSPINKRQKSSGLDVASGKDNALENASASIAPQVLQSLQTLQSTADGLFDYVNDSFGYSWPIPSNPDNKVGVECLCDKLVYVQAPLADNHTVKELMELTCRFLGVPIAGQSAGYSTMTVGSVSPVSCVADQKDCQIQELLTPGFSLIVYTISRSNNEISQVFYDNFNTVQFSMNWMEISRDDAKYKDMDAEGTYGIQALTAEEKSLSNGEGNMLESGPFSMGVCVSIECRGDNSAVQDCCTDPFITYVHEKDDFASFRSRCEIINGGVLRNCDSLEMHVLRPSKRNPLVVWPPPADTVSPPLNDGISLENVSSVESKTDGVPAGLDTSIKIWKYFKEIWPYFAESDAANARKRINGVIFPKVTLVARFGSEDGEELPTNLPNVPTSTPILPFRKINSSIKISG